MRKTFVLDTNVLLTDFQSVLKFEEHAVVIPMTVIEELDRFKKEMNELGRNARQFSHLMDDLRSKGSLLEGVVVNDKGGTLRIVFCGPATLYLLPADMDHGCPDNQILAVTKELALQHSPTLLISKDINMRIKADALGITAETYENGRVEVDNLYSGVLEVETEEDIPPLDYLHPNQFVVVAATGQELRYDQEQQALLPLREDLESWGLAPANEEQRYLMDLLLDDSINLVTVNGKAGCGKTLCSIAASLRKVTDDFVYRKLLVSRPVMPMGKDIGYLPGTIEEKYSPYLQPIKDNIEFLVSGGMTVKPATKKRGKKGKDEEEKLAGMLENGYAELAAAGILELEPLLYIRGRSIPNVILLVDEAQNLSPHEIKTVVTRAGKNTKLIFTGDIEQIDHPYLDQSSNGLTYLIEKMKGQRIAGHITLTKGERSELAEIASQLL